MTTQAAKTFGVVMTNGYFSFTLDDPGWESDSDALDHAYQVVTDGETELYGVMQMPQSPPHPYAPARINPAHVVAVVEKTGKS
jgi:hypothetical protein